MNLSAIDPNLVIGLVSLLGAGATWLYHRIKGDKVDSTGNMIRGLVDSAIHIADVEAESHPDEVRARVTAYVWITLLKLKVPRNATTELLVNEAIEVAISKAIQAAKYNEAAEARIMSRAQANIAKAQALAANPSAPLPSVLEGVSLTIIDPHTGQPMPAGSKL